MACPFIFISSLDRLFNIASRLDSRKNSLRQPILLAQPIPSRSGILFEPIEWVADAEVSVLRDKYVRMASLLKFWVRDTGFLDSRRRIRDLYMLGGRLSMNLRLLLLTRFGSVVLVPLRLHVTSEW